MTIDRHKQEMFQQKDGGRRTQCKCPVRGDRAGLSGLRREGGKSAWLATGQRQPPLPRHCGASLARGIVTRMGRDAPARLGRRPQAASWSPVTARPGRAPAMFSDLRFGSRTECRKTRLLPEREGKGGRGVSTGPLFLGFWRDAIGMAKEPPHMRRPLFHSARVGPLTRPPALDPAGFSAASRRPSVPRLPP